MQDGFSLIEIVMTLAIMTIIVMIAMPNESSFIHKTDDTVLSQQLWQAIALAQNEAMSRRETMSVCGSRDLMTCSDDWSLGYLIKADESVLHVYQPLSTQGVLEQRFFPKGQTVLTFLSSGKTATENGTLWYCNQRGAKARWAIVISQSGRARKVLPDANGDVRDSSGVILSC